jgi:hypothetical protein
LLKRCWKAVPPERARKKARPRSPVRIRRRRSSEAQRSARQASRSCCRKRRESIDSGRKKELMLNNGGGGEVCGAAGMVWTRAVVGIPE